MVKYRLTIRSLFVSFRVYQVRGAAPEDIAVLQLDQIEFQSKIWKASQGVQKQCLKIQIMFFCQLIFKLIIFQILDFLNKKSLLSENLSMIFYEFCYVKYWFSLSVSNISLSVSKIYLTLTMIDQLFHICKLRPDRVNIYFNHI